MERLPQYLTITDICDRLGISPDTLKRWRNELGFPVPVALPARRTSRAPTRLRWDEADVASWWNAHTRTRTVAPSRAGRRKSAADYLA